MIAERLNDMLADEGGGLIAVLGALHRLRRRRLQCRRGRKGHRILRGEKRMMKKTHLDTLLIEEQNRRRKKGKQRLKDVGSDLVTFVLFSCETEVTIFSNFLRSKLGEHFAMLKRAVSVVPVQSGQRRAMCRPSFCPSPLVFIDLSPNFNIIFIDWYM